MGPTSCLLVDLSLLGAGLQAQVRSSKLRPTISPVGSGQGVMGARAATDEWCRRQKPLGRVRGNEVRYGTRRCNSTVHDDARQGEMDHGGQEFAARRPQAIR